MVNARALIDHFPYLGIFLLIVLGGLGLPFPEDTTLILSGFLVAHDVIKPIPAFLVLYPSLLGTDFFLYWVGRKYGRKIVEHPRFRRVLSPDRLSMLEKRFRERDVWVVIIGRHLWGLRAQIFLVAGVMRMSPIKFLLSDGATAIVTVALMGGIGYLGGNSITVLKKDLSRIEHIALLVLVLLIAGWFVLKYYKDLKRG